MKMLELVIPGYTVDEEPDYKAIGTLIDEEIKKRFMGQSILLRRVGSGEHQNKTVDELIEIIQKTGTDRYDPKRAGDRYENIENKHIDLFAFPAMVTSKLDLSWQVIYGFYHSAIAVYGRPVRIDVLIIYDATQLEEVAHQYEGGMT